MCDLKSMWGLVNEKQSTVPSGMTLLFLMQNVSRGVAEIAEFKRNKFIREKLN